MNRVYRSSFYFRLVIGAVSLLVLVELLPFVGLILTTSLIVWLLILGTTILIELVIVMLGTSLASIVLHVTYLPIL